MSELQGTHIFLVVIKQGKFSLHQHKLPLQKLWVLFTFLPQHPFIEPWIQFKISTQSPVLQYTQVLLKNEYVFMTWPNVLQRETIQTSFHFLTLSLCKEQVFLAQFCICMRKCIDHIRFTPTNLHSTVDMCEKTLPVVYERGGYLVSPVNSFLSYLARIHCSLKTLWFKGKQKYS